MDIKTDSNHVVMRSRPLIFLDLETTGLEIQKNEILEIGALKVSSKRPFPILAKLSVKVKPKDIKNADKQALKMMGYTEEEWAEAINLEEALKQLDEFSENGILVGYNVSFDFAVLDKAYFSLGRQDPFYYHRLDVMPMAYLKLFSKRKLRRFSLGEVSKYLELERLVAHRALDDAKMTYNIFKKLFKLNG